MNSEQQKMFINMMSVCHFLGIGIFVVIK